jgi:hypothetical protein
MSTNTNLIIAGLDFAQIKENFKNYLRNNSSEFSDYNFEGSSLSVLINLLSYNTQYNAYYLNMVANEMFVDTAILRDSVISHAKSLGYTPRSAVGAKANINISLTVPDTQVAPNQILLKRTDRFETIVDNTSYSFYPIQDYTATRVPTDSNSFTYSFSNITLTQGAFVQKRFSINSTTLETRRFILENQNIDAATIEVLVYATPTANNFTKYTNALNFVDIESTSTVFFIQEKNNGFMEIYFGDNVIGKAPEPGNVVVVNYLVTDTNEVNGSQNIAFSESGLDSLQLTNSQINAGITLLERIDGGSAAESIESIRLKAPRHYASQYRTVTEDDFIFQVESVYPNIDSMKVWGGQDNDPPFYGKVFISIKPKGNLTLTEFEKSNIRTAIQSRSLVTIIPEFVDPSYVNVLIDTVFKYNSNLTNDSTNFLKTNVRTAILGFCENSINSFDSVLRFSKLVKEIDSVDAAILSNVTRIKLEKEFDISFIDPTFIEINFVNSVMPGTLVSNKFTINDSTLPQEDNYNLFFRDDGEGNIDLYNTTVTGERILRPGVGMINYNSGRGNIDNIDINSLYVGDKLVITVEPATFDVRSFQNTILTISEDDISVDSQIEII